MNVLVLGSGGREHALSWKIAQSPKCSRLFIAPGNAGTSAVGQNVPLGVNDFAALGEFILQNDVTLLVVGPEDPLVNGIRDYFESRSEFGQLRIVGPGKAGAALEGSKDFSKLFMSRHGIPTARFATFSQANLQEGLDYLETLAPPYVLKADGLAAGKGVIIAPDLQVAQESLREMLVDKKFGAASERVLIEEFLDGIELSVFVLTDGENYVVLPEAKDYKRIGERDTGLNTGGMGAVSPVPFADKDFLDKVTRRVIEPTVQGLKNDGIDYKGFIFIGLMNIGGDPYVIEYNVRMGDPETQAVIPRIQSDLLELLLASAEGRLGDTQIEISGQTTAAIVMVSGGYPEAYQKNHVISGLREASSSLIFHAGTGTVQEQIVSTGGRVLAVTGMGTTIREALEAGYAGVDKISWKDCYFRGDIGQDLLKLLE